MSLKFSQFSHLMHIGNCRSIVLFLSRHPGSITSFLSPLLFSPHTSYAFATMQIYPQESADSAVSGKPRPRPCTKMSDVIANSTYALHLYLSSRRSKPTQWRIRIRPGCKKVTSGRPVCSPSEDIFSRSSRWLTCREASAFLSHSLLLILTCNLQCYGIIKFAWRTCSVCCQGCPVVRLTVRY